MKLETNRFIGYYDIVCTGGWARVSYNVLPSILYANSN